MFCGWRLANSYSDIEALGSGTLVIDALSGNATFNGASIGPLNIAGELHAWLHEDCQNNDIPLTGIRHARLTAELDLSKTEWKGRSTNTHWFDENGGKIVWRQINRCVINCRSTIKTDDHEYQSVYDDVEEWPEGFPGQTNP
jgi:hypothetical protein